MRSQAERKEKKSNHQINIAEDMCVRFYIMCHARAIHDMNMFNRNGKSFEKYLLP